MTISTTRSAVSRGTKRGLMIWLILCLILALILPYWLSPYVLGLLTVAYYYGVFAMSWDLLFGYAGEVNFGPTVLIGLGAYTAALMNNWGYPIVLCLIVGIFAAVVGGLVLAIPALRLHGPYFGLLTLVAVLLLRDFIVVFASVTGGEIGLMVPNVLSASAAVNYWYALIFMIISGGILVAYTRSGPGLILEAAGQDPTETEALGFSVYKHKIWAFVLSAIFSGLSGGLLVFYMGTASVDTVIDFGVIVQIIIAAVLGGRRTIIGGAVGAIFIILGNELLRPIGQANTVVVAVVALAVIIFVPNGMIGFLAKRWK